MNMKAIASLFCILALVTVSKSSPESEEEERMKAIYTKCRNETKLDETGPTDVNTKKTEQSLSPKAKCMMGCVMRESGMIVNGKFDKGGAIKIFEKYYPTKKDDMEKVKTVIDICEKRVTNETDECNLGGNVATCLSDESEKIGLTPVW